jgi:glycolate oxidase iron-sulfur subunit
VDTPRVVQAARAELARRKAGGRFKRFVLRKILPSRKLLPRLLKGARFTRALWAAKIPRDAGLHLRLLRGPRGERRRLPRLAKPFFLDRPRPEPAAGTRVALFVGCVSNYLRPEAAEAAVTGLQRAGASVIVPAGQGCCGLPAYGAGEDDAAARLARRNLDALLPAGGRGSWPEAITTPCASCAYMLGKYLPALLARDPLLSERARELSKRVVPFSRLWVRLKGVAGEGPGRRAEGPGPRLTYHDPCHLSRGFGEQDAPRFLLTSLPGAHFVEMEHPCHCCGHGGSFNVSHYDLSTEIARHKIELVLATGADLLVTECSGCTLQLAEALSRIQPGFEVISTAEALERYGEAEAAEK